MENERRTEREIKLKIFCEKSAKKNKNWFIRLLFIKARFECYRKNFVVSVRISNDLSRNINHTLKFCDDDITVPTLFNTYASLWFALNAEL